MMAFNRSGLSMPCDDSKQTLLNKGSEKWIQNFESKRLWSGRMRDLLKMRNRTKKGNVKRAGGIHSDHRQVQRRITSRALGSVHPKWWWFRGKMMMMMRTVSGSPNVYIDRGHHNRVIFSPSNYQGRPRCISDALTNVSIRWALRSSEQGLDTPCQRFPLHLKDVWKRIWILVASTSTLKA